MKTRLLAGFSILLMTLFGTEYSSAQVELSPGVGRVSLIHGDVSTQRGDSGDWAAAALNQPIVSGDKISTAGRSRTEVQLDYANILRLSDNSQATIATLERTHIQIQLGQGLANFNVLKGSEADVEINTPNVAIRPILKEGVYRIEVNSTGETRVIVRKGEVEISTPQGSTRVEKGDAVTVRGTGDDTQYKVAGAPSKDSWDSWNSDRNGLIRNAQSWSRTNRYYVGSEDLDAYGHWIDVPDYGPVWAPVVGVDWAPYRAGRWVWEPYWGWTWVSYEPWGWAPYHYGRWFMYGASWVWWPGPVYGYRYYRPLWAPAYVSFFGFGGAGWGLSFGFGSLGWLPVGPCDRFFPWYGRYRSRFNVVNIINITNITNIRGSRGFAGIGPLHGGNRYSNLRLAATNERFQRAISTVPAEHFGTGRVSPTPMRGGMFRDGRMMTGNLPIVPTRATLSASNRSANPATLHGGQERFFMKSRPNTPQAFDRQAAQVEQSIQRSGRFAPMRPGVQSAQTNAGRPMQGRMEQGAAIRNAGNSSRVMNSAPAEGWRRFGTDIAQSRRPDAQEQSSSRARPSPSSRPQNGNPQSARPGASDQSGWRRFSDSSGGRTVHRPSVSEQPRENRVPRPPSAREASPRYDNSMNRGSRTAEPSRNDGWRRFPSGGASEVPNRGGQGNDSWGRFPSRREGPSNEGRPSVYRDSNRGYRPPLDLSRPIVTPRQSPGWGGGGGGRSGGYQPSPRSGGGGARGGSGGGGGQSRQSSGNRHR
jgi:hypothetical protein